MSHKKQVKIQKKKSAKKITQMQVKNVAQISHKYTSKAKNMQSNLQTNIGYTKI